MKKRREQLASDCHLETAFVAYGAENRLSRLVAAPSYDMSTH
jgi:hypothetical protein